MGTLNDLVAAESDCKRLEAENQCYRRALKEISKLSAPFRSGVGVSSLEAAVYIARTAIKRGSELPDGRKIHS